jgi:hypothetical protein
MRSGGIETSVYAPGYQCFRYEPFRSADGFDPKLNNAKGFEVNSLGGNTIFPMPESNKFFCDVSGVVQEFWFQAECQ